MKDEVQTLFATVQIIIPDIFQGLQLKGPYIKSLAGLWILEFGKEWPFLLILEDDENEEDEEEEELRGDDKSMEDSTSEL